MASRGGGKVIPKGKSSAQGAPNAHETMPVSSNIDISIPAEFQVFADVLDALPFYVLLIDENHYILQANKAVQSELGFTPEQIVGKYCPKIVHGCDQCYEGCPLEEAIEVGATVEKEIFDSKTGHWVLSSIYPTTRITPDGKKIFLHTVLDITKRKKAEKQLNASRERLRRISKHLESVREEERRRIARDLHDETSQLVTGLAAYLEAAGGLLPETAVDAKSVIERAKGISFDILSQIHSLIHELHPALLDKLGLVAAIRSLIENNLKARDIKVYFSTTGKEMGLSYEQKMALYRVIQEAISNIIRHAHAGNVKIRLSFKKASVRVNIQDDGQGFNSDEAFSFRRSNTGFGLMSMQERVELLSGSFCISSKTGCGTEIDVEIPLGQEVDCE